MLNGSLEDHIGTSEELNLLTRSILQAVLDHGGNTGHVNTLLAETKKNRVTLDSFAREMIGGLWNTYNDQVDLDLNPIFYKLPQDEHVAYYTKVNPRINVLPIMTDMAGIPGMRWVTKPPRGPCRYVHQHFKMRVTLEHALSIYGNGESMLEYAGWMELVAYASRLSRANIQNFTIVAPGSIRTLEDGWKDVPIAFCAHSERITIGYRQFRQPDKEKFDTDCFFLARFYGPKR